MKNTHKSKLTLSKTKDIKMNQHASMARCFKSPSYSMHSKIKASYFGLKAG